jgi:hypothetical protein
MTQPTIPVTITWKSIKSFVREVASIAGLVVGLGNQLHLPPATQATLVAVSGWLQVTSHKIDKLAASTTANPTNPTGGPS